MNIQAIWEGGVFRPAQPLTLKRHLVTLVEDEQLIRIGSVPPGFDPAVDP